MHVPVKPRFGVGTRIGPNITGITVRQVKGKKVSLLFHPANYNQGFAKVCLGNPPIFNLRYAHIFCGFARSMVALLYVLVLSMNSLIFCRSCSPNVIQ
jgi:hypothetical protein